MTTDNSNTINDTSKQLLHPCCYTNNQQYTTITALYITMDFAFAATPEDTAFPMGGHSTAIGHDILDIGSRKGQARRQRGAGIIGDDMSPAPINMTGMPGQFDLPNVDDVSSVLLLWLVKGGDWVVCLSLLLHLLVTTSIDQLEAPPVALLYFMFVFLSVSDANNLYAIFSTVARPILPQQLCFCLWWR